MTHDPDQLAFWGLQQAPFDDTRNTRFFFNSRAHQDALNRMIYLVRQGRVHFGLLSGDIGSGKSITASVLASRISDPDRHVVYLPNSQVDYPHLLADIITHIVDDVEFDTYDEYVLTRAFGRVCEQYLATRNRQLVVVLDEAQDLPTDTLQRLRTLTNLGSTHEEYQMMFVLVGQTPLRQAVQALPALDQRVALRFHLGPLAGDEVGTYLRHRLIVAGHADGNIFDEACFAQLAEVTGCIPRELNRYARLTMDNARARRVPRIDAACLDEIVADQRVQEGIA
ncbi:MAG: ExeA family protein [Planctomycetota bacterium]